MTSTTLHIRLLDAFSLVYGDEPVAGVNTPRLQSLFAWLVLHRDAPQSRQRLAFLFWPNSTETQARNNLRQTLHTLRLALPDVDTFLHADASVVRWLPDAPFTLDVAEFERSLAVAEGAARQDDDDAMRAALEQALTLYQMELLPGCYDDWVTPERERLRHLYLQALDQLTRLLEARRDYPAAVGYAQRLIRSDPLNEESYYRLMRLLALRGNRAGALQVYRACARVLRRELGIAPSQATSEMYQRILRSDSAVVSAPDEPRPNGGVNAPSPSDASAPIVPSTPSLVGRRRECERLSEAWANASANGPGFALITGEAGIGKSRLAEDFLLWVQRHGGVTAMTRCYAAEGQLSLAPVTDWLRSEGLRPSLDNLDSVWLTEVSRILPDVVSAHPDLPHYEPISEYGQRRRFFEALARAVLAAPQPLLLFIDDVHWCDQETLEWLHFLLRFDANARILVLACARAEEMLPSHPAPTSFLHLRNTIGWTEIPLEPLDAAETAKLAAQIVGHEPDTPWIMRLFHETEGNPLFVVETLRASLDNHLAGGEGGRGEADDAITAPLPSVPPRVRGVIAARLAKLSEPARALAITAATIGREFSVEVLAQAAHLDEDSVVQALDELWQKRIVREQDAFSYDFSHDKIREIAYAEISVPQRRLLHRRVAEALERIYADDLDVVSGQIASHHENAGLAERALPYYQRAAQVAQRIYANDDAIAMLTRALSLLQSLPPGAKRDTRELALLLSLSVIYRITKGWTAPELEQTLDRALSLCDTVGDDTQRAEALYGFQSLLVVQAKLDRVQLVSEELEALYKRIDRPVSPFPVMTLAGAQYHLGKLSDANDTFEAIIREHDDPIHATQELQGWNFAIHSRAWQSHVLWCLGYPAQALSRGTEAVRLASELALPFNLALASTYLAMLQQFCVDPETASAQAEDALATTSEYRVPYYRAWSIILVDYARASAQPSDEHLERLRQSIAAFMETGARLRLPYYLWLQARICIRLGLLTDALAAIDDAMTASRTNNERWWDAELHRLRADVIQRLGADASDVEMAFRRSLAVARLQDARSLELRSAVDFAQFLHARDRGAEAYPLLRDVYHWFTEGLDSPDLLRARTLLEALA